MNACDWLIACCCPEEVPIRRANLDGLRCVDKYLSGRSELYGTMSERGGKLRLLVPLSIIAVKHKNAMCAIGSSVIVQTDDE